LVDSEAGDFRLEASNKAAAHMRIAYALRRSRKIKDQGRICRENAQSHGGNALWRFNP
jgi:hypothetical protein